MTDSKKARIVSEGPVGTDDPEATRGLVLENLERILESSEFAQSESLKRFLSHVVTETLDGRGDELKELTLGSAVFERGAEYDPRIDPIVRVQATRLRAKLLEYYENAGPVKMRIEIPKGRYVPEFHRLEDLDYQPPAPEETPRVPLAYVALIVGIVIVVAVTWWIVRDAAVATPETEAIRSVAVLPFTDMSPSSDHAFYGDGLADEITTTLAAIDGLDVVPRTTAFAYRDLEVSVLGERLSVDAVLQGSVRRADRKLRIAAQLIRASDGHQIWSASYDEDDANVFTVQERIASSVAVAVEHELLPGTRERPEPLAYERYLRGRFELSQAAPQSSENAVALFEEAIALDADYAPSYAGLVQALVMDVLWGFTAPSNTRALAREASAHALRLDGSHPEALSAAAAYQLIYEMDLDAARTILERADTSDSDELLVIAGLVSVAENDLARAAEELARATRVAPSVAFTHFLVATLAHYAGDDDEAMAQLSELDVWAPDFALGLLLKARILGRRGAFDEASSVLTDFDRVAGESPMGAAARGVLHARAGEREQALLVLDRLRDEGRNRYVSPALLARVEVALGDVEGAFDELSRAARERSLPVLALAADPAFEPLRSDRRFEELKRVAEAGE